MKITLTVEDTTRGLWTKVMVEKNGMLDNHEQSLAYANIQRIAGDVAWLQKRGLLVMEKR